MAYETSRFWERRRTVLKLYQNGCYREALEEAYEAARIAPEYDSLTSFWIACLLCRLGEPDRALSTLCEAYDRGCWWGKELLLGDPDLRPLHGHLRFQVLVARCEERKKIMREQTKPKILTLTPPGFRPDQPHPVLIAFHHRMGTASECLELFSPSLDMGFLLCALQDTQIVAEDMYVWDDQELSNHEAQWGYAQISKDFSVERKQVFLAGVSQGAGLAMELAVSGALPSGGFAAVNPAVSRFEFRIPQAAEAARRGLRGWIFIGQQFLRAGFRPRPPPGS